jgi:hypothetical protein
MVAISAGEIGGIGRPDARHAQKPPDDFLRLPDRHLARRDRQRRADQRVGGQAPDDVGIGDVEASGLRGLAHVADRERPLDPIERAGDC